MSTCCNDMSTCCDDMSTCCNDMSTCYDDMSTCNKSTCCDDLWLQKQLNDVKAVSCRVVLGMVCHNV